MKAKVSDAQIEVWEWKDALFEEIKDIPKLERLNYIKNKVSKTLAKIKSRKIQSS